MRRGSCWRHVTIRVFRRRSALSSASSRPCSVQWSFDRATPTTGYVSDAVVGGGLMVLPRVWCWPALTSALWINQRKEAYSCFRLSGLQFVCKEWKSRKKRQREEISYGAQQKITTTSLKWGDLLNLTLVMTLFLFSSSDILSQIKIFHSVVLWLEKKVVCAELKSDGCKKMNV